MSTSPQSEGLSEPPLDQLSAQSTRHPNAPFSTLLDETSFGAMTVDASLRVTYCNLPMSVMFPAQAVAEGSCLRDHLVLSDLQAMLSTAIQGHRRIESRINRQFSAGHSGSDDRTYRAIAGPIEPADGGGGWIILEDITEQVITEQIRRDFVTNASHELCTPLSLISGYIETLQSGIIKTGPPLTRCLKVMEIHSARMMRIIDDMLTISRLENENSYLNMELFSVNHCVEDVLRHLHALIELRKPIITLDLPDEGGDLFGDRFYWDQIFTNLVENALKENPREGLHVTIRGRWSDYEVVLEVIDNGIGIDAEDVPFVFKRFYRCTKHHNHEFRGTGLGLSIVKRAVEAHGGSIELSSSPEVETVFTMRIPVFRH